MLIDILHSLNDVLAYIKKLANSLEKMMSILELFYLHRLIVAENSLNKVNQPNDRLNELDKKGEVAKDKFNSLPQRNKTRDKGRWESIDQLNADDVMKFQAWLDVEEIMLKDQLPEASSSSQSPSEDADI
ncbi:hypothetical protein P3S68_008589 [Capsicum galapagoense]